MSAAIRYAKSGDVHVAYQVLGDGPRDLIVIMEGFIPVDVMDDEPRMARVMTRLGSFARLIRFDRRGIGLSDPVAPTAPPTLEQWVEDALAVLDAVGSSVAVVLASAEASPVALLLAASHPERVSALVIVNGFARALVDGDYPQGAPVEVLERFLAETNPSSASAGPDSLALMAPSAANDPQFRQWSEQAGHRGASPATARALLTVAFEGDVRGVLPSIRAPSLIVHFADDPLTKVDAGRYLAERISGAVFVEVRGADDFWWGADNARAVLDEIEEFLTGARSAPRVDRVLATVLYTDIVSSTERATELGDLRWRDLLDRHDAATRRQLARFRGHEVKMHGDGFLATFDGPARAVECAGAIRDAAGQLGLDVRIGLHTGEVEVRGDDIGGLAVHIGQRVASHAAPGEVLVSRTVKDLVVGSGIAFADRGVHALKGVPDTWQLYAVEGANPTR